MNRKIIVTADKSKSIEIPDLNETYHSVNGARDESHHVFIQHGLNLFLNQPEIHIFEMGFGTGLNLLLTLQAAQKSSSKIIYHTCEKYPLDEHTLRELNYPAELDLAALSEPYYKAHQSAPATELQLNEQVTFCRFDSDIHSLELIPNFYTLIYYDAFSPKIQPDLWDEHMMKKMADILLPDGALITYCAQGQFRRNLKAAGLSVEKLPGPAGKREITRARSSAVKV